MIGQLIAMILTLLVLAYLVIGFAAWLWCFAFLIANEWRKEFVLAEHDLGFFVTVFPIGIALWPFLLEGALQWRWRFIEIDRYDSELREAKRAAVRSMSLFEDRDHF